MNTTGKVTLLVLFFSLLTITFCDKKREYTPEQVLENIKTAYHNKDAETLISHLSREKIEKLEKSLQIMRDTFSNLPESTQAILIQNMKVKSKQLSEITLAEYLRYNMYNEGTGMDAANVVFPIHILNEYKITARNFTQTEGSITLADTSAINFVKQDNEWKISQVKWLQKVPEPDAETPEE